MSRGSLLELEEIGQNTSVEVLAETMKSADRQLVLASIGAASTTRDSWLLLAPLAKRAASADRPIAAAAAEVAMRIAGELDSDAILDGEIDDSELEAGRTAWRALAARPGHWPDVRVRAMEIGLFVDRALDPSQQGLSDEDLDALAGDLEPEVRRAAFELLPQNLSEAAARRCSSALVEDADSRVALAAAQSLCGQLAHPGKTEIEARSVTERVLYRLGEAESERIRALVLEPDSPPVGLLDAARCLAARAQEADVAALSQLVERGPSAIRPDVRRLVAEKRL